ncbi:hypothetical protein [Pedococcus bigeumensis]|uniref:Thioredoxin domain-containing protein n=1 Tax=Pedococcus bigeumensis TaxID=433644 RepID=A0A502CX33_9MICO|nr:hypothetical protein [Pedococcus bigeumensis]TPG18145.1 hypothetical protein EAH86_07020 [Pedococcus bigeumensis]
MRPNQLLPTAIGAVLLTLPLAACGTDLGAQGIPLSTNAFDAAVGEVKAAGKPAYYLGSKADDLPLTSLDLVEENAPAFQVEADYGTCESAGDGGCSAPVVVSTNDWHPDVQGLTCRRLEPQLGVPAGVLMGELTLTTGRLVVTVSDFRGRGASDDVQPAVSLLSQLRSVVASQPLGTLPPPDPDVAAWMDDVCGSTPGREVSHPLEAAQHPLDNSHVPDFTVERLGGGQLTWADYRRKPVVIVVGPVPQVSTTVRRLQPLLATSPSHPTLLGLVTDPTGDKFNPRPVADIERAAGALPVPVGYAAVPLSAVWFLDAASNTGVDVGMDGCVVAFVDAAGAVVHFATPSTPDGQLTEWARALG